MAVASSRREALIYFLLVDRQVHLLEKSCPARAPVDLQKKGRALDMPETGVVLRIGSVELLWGPVVVAIVQPRRNDLGVDHLTDFDVMTRVRKRAAQ